MNQMHDDTCKAFFKEYDEASKANVKEFFDKLGGIELKRYTKDVMSDVDLEKILPLNWNTPPKTFIKELSESIGDCDYVSLDIHEYGNPVIKCIEHNVSLLETEHMALKRLTKRLNDYQKGNSEEIQERKLYEKLKAKYGD